MVVMQVYETQQIDVFKVSRRELSFAFYITIFSSKELRITSQQSSLRFVRLVKRHHSTLYFFKAQHFLEQYKKISPDKLTSPLTRLT